MAYATDKEVVEAFQILAQTEGILAALESCHAIAETIKQAKKMQPDQIIVANVSGRADNYIFNVAKGLGDQAFKDFCREFEE
jgi:tryptophan synthase beta chain